MRILPAGRTKTILSLQDIALASALTLLGPMLGLILIATTASRSRRYLRSPLAVRRLNRSADSIMVGAVPFLVAKP